MSTINQDRMTLADHAKRMDPNGKHARLCNLLSQTNEVLSDMTWREGNLTTGHRSTIVTGLPGNSWSKLYKGTPPTKGRTAQVDETTGKLEARSHVDERLLDLTSDKNELRMEEARLHLESMNQTMASSIFYGDATLSPETFNGLSMRYNDLSANNAQNIIDAGGTSTDNTSMWMVCWSNQTVSGIFPKETQAGLVQRDLGVEDVNDEDGNPYRAAREHFSWDAGVLVRDWRYAVRIANIDISDLTENSGSQAKLIQLMIKALHRIPNLQMGRCAFYANRTVHEMLDIQANEKSNVLLNMREFDGMWVPAFRGVPIRKVDALLETEDRVV